MVDAHDLQAGEVVEAIRKLAYGLHAAGITPQIPVSIAGSQERQFSLGHTHTPPADLALSTPQKTPFNAGDGCPL